MAQWLDHCVSSAKIVGSIPREHMCRLIQKTYCLNALHCKSLWINVISKSCHRRTMLETIIEIQAHFARVDHVVIQWLSLFK